MNALPAASNPPRRRALAAELARRSAELDAHAESAELFPEQVGVRPRADEGEDENVVANEVDE